MLTPCHVRSPRFWFTRFLNQRPPSFPARPRIVGKLQTGVARLIQPLSGLMGLVDISQGSSFVATTGLKASIPFWDCQITFDERYVWD
jgi:hypothetical protein